jgi:hypothetical protein
MKKVTLATRILAVLKGGDEAKLTRFESKLEKFYEKQIAKRKDAMESLRDSLVDAQDALQETVVSVDLDRIATSTGAEDYCASYTKQVEAKMETIDTLEDKIKSLQDEIDHFIAIKNVVFTQD